MRTALLLSLSLSLLACGGSKPPVETAAPAKVYAPVRSAIFFVVAYEALLPVGCFDMKAGAWRTGEKCLDMLPDDASVGLESGRTAKAKGFRVPTIDFCTLSTPLLMFEEAALEKPASWAVWPPSVNVTRISWDATKKGSEGLAPEDRNRLAQSMKKLAPATDVVSIVQIAPVDLEGDGTNEIFYSANGGGFDPATGAGISGLFFLARGKDEIVPVRSSNHAVFRVEAIVDLDGDGRKEVFVTERTFHPNGRKTDTATLVHTTDGGLAPLAPMETCWPPPQKIKPPG